MKKRLFLLPLLCLASLASCDQTEQNTIQKEEYTYEEDEFIPVGLDIKYMNKGIFSRADEFPLDELRIYLIDEYYERRIVPTGDCNITYPDISTPGTKTIYVSYGEFELEDEISVVDTITFPCSYFGSEDNAPDKEYLYLNSGAGRDSGGLRFADENAYWIYKFSFDKIIDEVTLIMNLANEYSILASNDGNEWKEIAFGLVGAGNRLDSNDVEIDIKSSFTDFSKNNGDLYIKFADENPSDGFGCVLRTFRMNYILSDKDKVIRDLNTFVLTTNGTNDANYLVNVTDNDGGTNEQVGNDGGIYHRFADEKASFTFGFDFQEPIFELTAKFEVRFQYHIEVSFDNSTWNDIVKTTNQNNWEFVEKAINLTDNASVVYLRFSDGNTNNGFGCSLRNITLYYVLNSGATRSVVPVQ